MAEWIEEKPEFSEYEPVPTEETKEPNPSGEAPVIEEPTKEEVPTEVLEETPVEVDPSKLTTDQAVKGGPGDYSWGGFEDQKKQKAGSQIQKPPNVSQEDWDNRPEWSRPLEDVLHAGSTVGAGVLDFAFDAASMTQIPFLKSADEWWDTHSPRSKDPSHTLVRDASAIIVPTLYGASAINGVDKAVKFRHIPKIQKTLATLLAHAGLDVSVAAISSQSYEQDNMAGALNKWLGWNLPFSTSEDQSEEERRHNHIYEAATFSFATSVLGVFGALSKKVRLIGKDQKTINLLEQRSRELREILEDADLDPATKSIVTKDKLRTRAQQKEALKRIKNKQITGQETKYDPFINEPARPEQRAISPDELELPDPVGAKVSQYKIQNNLGTLDGIMPPSTPTRVMDLLTDTTDVSQRSKTLVEFFQSGLSANTDVIIGKNKISAADLNKAVDNLVENIFNPRLSFKQFQKIVNKNKSLVFEGRKFLSEEAWLTSMKAWEKVHADLFNPNNMRASAMMQQQAADVISTTARSMELLDGIGTNSRQWEIMSNKLKFLVGEVTTNKDIVRRAAELEELVEKGDFNRVASWLNAQSDGFNAGISASKRKAFGLIDEIERIAKEHPNYMRPLAEAYDATNGDVNTLYHLHKWGEANIGFLKKAIFDKNPEMPSFIIQGLHAIRYNSILNGLAPVRALLGNSIIATVKPISVFAGATLQGDIGTFRRSMYVYGGLAENFKRGFKMLGSDWRLANSNPEVAAKRGRQDFRAADTARLQAQESLSETWRAEGKHGKVMMWNIGKAQTMWNNWKYNRWGINGLYAIDGFFKSLMASGSARAKAYDTLLEATNGAFSSNQFRDLQRSLYDQAFDNTGKLTDSAANFASKELALNLDYKWVSKFESFAGHVPAAKALFMFPRTGVNGFELAWSFNPVSNLGPAITRARRTLAAVTDDEIAEVLAEHGLENTPAAFKALQSEYLGRQIMGTGVVMGAGMWALEGNLTGNGPQDPAERKRMIQMGWQPLSIKHPITGKWHSYRGFEPFEQLLGLVGDGVYYSERVDQSIAEDWFSKIATAISLNITNKTFTSGFEPLVSMMSGDEAAWNRFWAQQVNTSLPQAGVRTILNNLVSPQLRDVKNEFKYYLMNSNKFMFPGNSKNLPNMIDVYTGDPIKFHEPMIAAANSVLPFFKQNGGMEPWRQWLLSTGWDGLTEKRIDKISGGELDPHARQWINNWIGKHGGLKGQIIDLMKQSDDQWSKQLNDYKKSLGIAGEQRDLPIKELLLHRELDRIHTEVYGYALSAYDLFLKRAGDSAYTERALRGIVTKNLRSGNVEDASKARDKLIQYK